MVGPETQGKETLMSQPAHKIRIGTLQVTIWRNHADNNTWYSVIPTRGYKKGDEWKETESLNADDLLPMAKLLDQAHTWVVNQQQADSKARKAAAKEEQAAAA
jgi:hypothetical protein